MRKYTWVMQSFKARIILLGASNVTKGVSVIIETAQRMFGSPLDVYAAIGHGRSYGLKSFVLVRSLPSILDSHVWEVVREQPDVPTYALVGDIGNDVMYGPPPEQIAWWIEQSFDRLGAIGAKTICTGLPLDSIDRLKKWEYLAARTLMFPTKRITFEAAKQRSHAIAQRVQSIAAERTIPFIQLPGAWYGIDPIHIRPGRKALAWSSILSHWLSEEQVDQETVLARGSLSRWIKLRSSSPEKWWLLGMQRGRQQPSATLADGTQVSLY